MHLRLSLSDLEGQMVWFFERTEDQSEFTAKPGVLLKYYKQKMLCDILFNNEVIVIADTDVMPMEIWDEKMEREDGEMEEAGERTRGHGRTSFE